MPVTDNTVRGLQGQAFPVNPLRVCPTCHRCPSCGHTQQPQYPQYPYYGPTYVAPYPGSPSYPRIWN